MNTSVIFVWIIVIVVFTGLIVFLRFRNKKSKEKKLSPLFNFARENNCEISMYDRWDKTLIGLDNSVNNKLFFIRKVADKEVKKIVNLSEIKNCHITKTTRTASFNRENVIVTDKIELVLTPVEKSKSDVVLEFYNTDYDSLNLSGELQLTEKWVETLNKLIGGTHKPDKKIDNVKSLSTVNKLQAKAGVL